MQEPKKIIITISATETHQYPPGLSDGTVSLPPGGPEDGDREFTILVEENQKIQFVSGGEAVVMGIVPPDGATHYPENRNPFSTEPSDQNGLTGVIRKWDGPSAKFTINYRVGNNKHTQDPELRMKR